MFRKQANQVSYRKRDNQRGENDALLTQPTYNFHKSEHRPAKKPTNPTPSITTKVIFWSFQKSSWNVLVYHWMVLCNPIKSILDLSRMPQQSDEGLELTVHQKKYKHVWGI